MIAAKKFAEKALRALANEDLIYSHHGILNARPKAYERLAEFFEEYARDRSSQDRSKP